MLLKDYKPGMEFDPQDEELKKSINEKADKKNYVMEYRNRLSLRCGANKRKRPGEFCKSHAGTGTEHPGYGRCKWCGGNARRFDPYKQKMVLDASREAKTIHGFYSSVLAAAERKTYQELLEQKTISLEDEIFMIKAKILSYLKKWQLEIDQGGEMAAKQYTKDVNGVTSYYIASTADDPVLKRALETLRRLVDSQAKLNPGTGEGLLDSINKELRSASQGEVTLAWGSRTAQTRSTKDEEG